METCKKGHKQKSRTDGSSDIIPGRRRSLLHVSWWLFATISAKKRRRDESFIVSLSGRNISVINKDNNNNNNNIPSQIKRILPMQLLPQLVRTLNVPSDFHCVSLRLWLSDRWVDHWQTLIAVTLCCDWPETRSVVDGVSALGTASFCFVLFCFGTGSSCVYT